MSARGQQQEPEPQIVSPTLPAPSSGVTIRMYHTGLGDCFLLAFATTQDGPAYYMLIDCGVLRGTEHAQARMREIAADIQQSTGGDIDLLVITHEHWDHVSGFQQATEIFSNIRIHNLWLGWTENDADTLAKDLRKQYEATFVGLCAAVRLGREAGTMTHLAPLLRFYGDVPPPNVALASFARSTRTAINLVKGWCTPVFLTPGNQPVHLPGSDNRPRTGPKVRVYVLGPPHCASALKRVNATVKGKETYGSDELLTPTTAFLMGLRHEDKMHKRMEAEEEDLYDDSTPFDEHVQIARNDAEQTEFFAPYFDAREDWRRIDYDWLGAAGELALQLDSYTNNTSLVLAIELVESRKVLLFTGDAQVGNWISWEDITWQVEMGDGSIKKVTVSDLLKRTVVYKVSHHGSHNGTMREKGLERMTHPDLVALLPVDEQMAKEQKHWAFPHPALEQRLIEKTGRRVIRSDKPLEAVRLK